jgi:hypothetical protein
MRVKVRAVGAKGEHEKKFGVHAWGGDLFRSQAGDGRG